MFPIAHKWIDGSDTFLKAMKEVTEGGLSTKKAGQ